MIGSFSLGRRDSPLSDQARPEEDITQRPDLDSPDTYARYDPSGIAARFLALPETARRGWELANALEPPAFDPRPRRVIVAGMGGSAIGGDLVRGLADCESPGLQVTSWRDYGLPAWAGRDTLVIGVSVSGNTVETRSAVREAARRGLPCIAITGPGPLLGEARDAAIPALEIDYSHEPRAGLAYTFVTLHRVLQKLGLMADAGAEFLAAGWRLESLAAAWGPASRCAANPAKQLALEMVDRLPVIYAARHLCGVAARWKTQVNENADGWSFAEFLPEAHHNSVQGYALPERLRDAVFLVVLSSQRYPDEVRARVRLTADLLAGENLPHRVVSLETTSLLAETLAYSLLGDMVAYYLAVLRGRDPSPTPMLTRLKQRVASAGGP